MSTTIQDNLGNVDIKKKQSRCESEKKRRDKLNVFIYQLQEMVCNADDKKMDKVTILRRTIDYLKNYKSQFPAVPSSIFNERFSLPTVDISNLLLQVMNGFILVLNINGKVVYISDIVQSVLGVSAETFVGKSIETLIHINDIYILSDRLINGGVTNDSPPYSLPAEEVVSLNFRMVANAENQKPAYRMLTCSGFWSQVPSSTESSGKVLVLLSRVNEDLNHYQDFRTANQPCVMFNSKHSLDGSFLFVDDSCTTITGYIPYELYGKSIYNYIHYDDIKDFSQCHSQVINRREALSLCFRFRSKANIWLLLAVQLQLHTNLNHLKPDYISISFKLITSNIESLEKWQSAAITFNGDKFNLKKDSTHCINIESQGDSNAEQIAANDQANLNSERFLEAQKFLQIQLQNKHMVLTKSFTKQKAQLTNIEKTMSDYVSYLSQPMFKKHLEQQVKMLNYFKQILNKQLKQQDYISRQLKGKGNELRIRQRAIKLRNMASRQQETLNNMQKPTTEHDTNSTLNFRKGKPSPMSSSQPPVSSSQLYSEKLNINDSTLTSEVPKTVCAENQDFVDNLTEQQLVTLLWRKQQQRKSQFNLQASTKQQHLQQKQVDQQKFVQTQLQQMMDQFQELCEDLQLPQSSLTPSQISDPKQPLQNLLSKQILVHLQVLQKHVIGQLQAVLGDNKDTNADFGKILPVLNQLQIIQQSILQQQNQANRENELSYSDNTFVNNNNVPFSSEMMANAVMVTFSKIATEDFAQSSTVTSPPQQQNGGLFGDQISFLELNKIAKTFDYPEEEGVTELYLKDDCFSTIPDNALQTLMYEENVIPHEPTTSQQDPKNLENKTKTEHDKEELSQPLTEHQQLEQLQRSQILSQQQDSTMSLAMAQATDSETMLSNQLPPIETGNELSSEANERLWFNEPPNDFLTRDSFMW